MPFMLLIEQSSCVLMCRAPDTNLGLAVLLVVGRLRVMGASFIILPGTGKGFFLMVLNLFLSHP